MLPLSSTISFRMQYKSHWVCIVFIQSRELVSCVGWISGYFLGSSKEAGIRVKLVLRWKIRTSFATNTDRTAYKNIFKCIKTTTKTRLNRHPRYTMRRVKVQNKRKSEISNEKGCLNYGVRSPRNTVILKREWISHDCTKQFSRFL